MPAARRFLLSLAALLACGSQTPAAAQQDPAPKPDPKWAAVDISQVDADFALQGEYQGSIMSPRGRDFAWRKVGVQVIARGNGEFEAAIYSGGLPGDGWDGSTPTRLGGRRSEDLLTLVDDPWTIAIRHDSATFTHAGLRSTYTIPKVHRVSPTLGLESPPEAIVLFDGSSAEKFKNGRIDADGALMEGADTLDAYKNFNLHLEFKLPYMPYARGQGRANSGVYIQSRYEVQILDSFGLDGAFNECGSLYRQQPPDVNMCLPPLAWQTYDITFISPQFDENGEKIRNARITVRHNGVLIHDNYEIIAKTGAGQKEGPDPLPTRLQNHGNPIRFRNIWLVELPDEPAYEESPRLAGGAPGCPTCGPAMHDGYLAGPISGPAGGHVIGGGSFAGPFAGAHLSEADLYGSRGVLSGRTYYQPVLALGTGGSEAYGHVHYYEGGSYYRSKHHHSKFHPGNGQQGGGYYVNGRWTPGGYNVFVHPPKPRPPHQYWRAERDFQTREYHPVTYYYPRPMGQHGYWAW